MSYKLGMIEYLEGVFSIGPIINPSTGQIFVILFFHK